MTWIQLIGGLILLAVGAEFLVRGASALAGRIGLSPLIIGLTVVAFGTSAPEIAVSLDATLDGRSAIAVGNVVGSNVFNVLFILGASALLTPMLVSRQVLRIDVPILIGISTLAWIMTLDGRLSPFDGVLLLLGFFAYTGFTIREGRKQAVTEGPTEQPRSALPVQVILILVGLGGLVLGAHWFVAGAVEIARWLGWSETVIGLTIVAAGTSLPEVATSVLAAYRGERDIAVGNVIGSNIFNLLMILGLTAVVGAGSVAVDPSIQRFDFPLMVAVAVALAPIALARGVIGRLHGGFFLLAYCAYTAYLVLDSKGHDALPAYSAVVLEFVLPIVVVTLIVMLVQGLRRSGNGLGEPRA